MLLFTKHATLMRRSTVLSLLPLHLEFPDFCCINRNQVLLSNKLALDWRNDMLQNATFQNDIKLSEIGENATRLNHTKLSEIGQNVIRQDDETTMANDIKVNGSKLNGTNTELPNAKWHSSE
jgi:hypothetical protein